MTLFPDIDKERTKENVHRLLAHYRSMARMADEEYTPKVTATYSLELKGASGVSDNVGSAVTRKATAEQELIKISKAMNKLNTDHRRLLHDRYIDKREMSGAMIYTSLNISERTYYKELEKSLLEFAEAYDGGRLLAEKRQINSRIKAGKQQAEGRE